MIGLMSDTPLPRRSAVRWRWTRSTEALWWLESGAAVALLVSPGLGMGLILVPLFVPLLVSYVRHGRSLGRVGFTYAALLISAQAVVVATLPLSGPGLEPVQWWYYALGLTIAIALAVNAWRGTDVDASAAVGIRPVRWMRR